MTHELLDIYTSFHAVHALSVRSLILLHSALKFPYVTQGSASTFKNAVKLLLISLCIKLYKEHSANWLFQNTVHLHKHQDEKERYLDHC